MIASPCNPPLQVHRAGSGKRASGHADAVRMLGAAKADAYRASVEALGALIRGQAQR